MKQILEGQTQIIKRLSSVEEGQKESKQDIIEMTQSLARIEQEQGSKIDVLFDARELQIDSAKPMSDTLNRIEATVEKNISQDRLQWNAVKAS